jgi:hypothetical protein
MSMLVDGIITLKNPLHPHNPIPLIIKVDLRDLEYVNLQFIARKKLYDYQKQVNKNTMIYQLIDRIRNSTQPNDYFSTHLVTSELDKCFIKYNDIKWKVKK